MCPLRCLTAEQEQQIRDLDYVKTVGTQYMVGSVAEKNDEGREAFLALSIMTPPNGKNTIRKPLRIWRANTLQAKMK